MDIKQLYLTRYDVLYSFWLQVVWEDVPADLLRKRPHPRLNSIAWNIWHLTRVEDSALNRFMFDRPQMLDEGGWMERMNVHLRHNGFGMTLSEVDELSQGVDLEALRGYSKAVEIRTRELIDLVTPDLLDEVLEEERLRVILYDEGLEGPNSEGLLENYTGWKKGACLMNLGLTHSFHHIGEINVIASLMGLAE